MLLLRFTLAAGTRDADIYAEKKKNWMDFCLQSQVQAFKEAFHSLVN